MKVFEVCAAVVMVWVVVGILAVYKSASHPPIPPPYDYLKPVWYFAEVYTGKDNIDPGDTLYLKLSDGSVVMFGLLGLQSVANKNLYLISSE